MFKKLVIALMATTMLAVPLVGCGAEIESDDSVSSNSVSTSENIEVENPATAPGEITPEEVDRRLALIESETLQYPGENEMYQYKVYTSYVEITDYLGKETKVIIPSEIEGLPVWVVGCSLIEGHEWNGVSAFHNITDLTLPDTVTVIKASAFSGCTKLKAIILPDSVATVENFAFHNCKPSQFKLSNNIQSIGSCSLPTFTEDFTIPASTKYIAREGFYFEGNVAVTVLSHDVVLYPNNGGHTLESRSSIYGDQKPTIRGYAGSTAVQFCLDSDYPFELIKE